MNGEEEVEEMRFRGHNISQSGGGIAGFFRPIIRFFRNIIAPIAKTAIKSSTGQKTIRALKEAGVGITADAISGNLTKSSAKDHFTKVRSKVAKALVASQRRGGSRSGVKGGRGKKASKKREKVGGVAGGGDFFL